MRAEQPSKDENETKRRSLRSSLYDVAPVLGAGALHVRRGHRPAVRETPTAPIALADWIEPLLPPGAGKAEPDDLSRADARLRRFATRGTFMLAQLDHEMWLNWGIADAELPALAQHSDTLVAEPPVQVPARFAPISSSCTSEVCCGRRPPRGLAQTAYATRESVGRGQVILFLNEPEFRGWTLGTRRLLVNAVLYGPGLGTRWSNPW